MKGTTIKPLFDYVLIKPVQGESRTPSGIVLPENAKEKPQVGEIMAIGPGKAADCDSGCCGGGCGCDDKSCKEGECESCGVPTPVVSIGQKVLYKKWAGNEVKVGNEEWLLVEQKDIMAIVE